ncbi:MAG: tetratricopeptide repeat protein [Acidobacteriota bacterium]
MRSLSDALSPQREGRGGILLLKGESGVGKTRLLLAFAAAARERGVMVLTGECLPPVGGAVSSGAPLQSLRRAFEAIADLCRERGTLAAERMVGRRLGVLAAAGLFEQPPCGAPVPVIDSAAARHRVLRSVAATLRAVAREEPICLVLDDLQWADELTLDLMLLLARGRYLERAPLIVVATYRTDEAGPELARLAASVPGELHVDRLDDAQVAAVVGDMLALQDPPPGLCEHVARASGGNPFFVAEYLRAAVATGIVVRDGRGRWMPGAAHGDWSGLAAGSVETIIRGRLERLDDDARELTSAAAVLGRIVDAEILIAASGLEESRVRRALSTLLAREILEEDGPDLRFAHHKIMETAYAARSGDERRRLHGAAAAAIEARHGAESPVHQAALGAHWCGAGEPARASACFLRAARAAASRYASLDSARLYRSYAASASGGEAEHTEALVELAIVLHRIGESTEALEVARRALDEAKANGAAALQARASRAIGSLLQRAGDLPGARHAQDRAIAWARAAGDGHVERLALLDLARLHHHEGRMDEARAAYEETLALGRTQGQRDLVARVTGYLAGHHHDQGRDHEARRLYEEALAIAREIGDQPQAAQALANIANLDSSRGRIQAALDAYTEALAIARSTGDRGLEGQVLGNLAVLRSRAEEPGVAEGLFRKALVIAREIDDRYAEGFVLLYLGEIARDAGRREEARSLFEQALAVHRAARDARGEALALGSVANLSLSEGATGEARRTCELALALHQTLGVRRSEALTLIKLSFIARRTGDLDAARDASARAVSLLDAAVNPIEASSSLVEQAHVSLALGTNARPLVERAEALAAEAGAAAESDLVASLARLAQALAAAEAGHELRYGETIVTAEVNPPGGRC